MKTILQLNSSIFSDGGQSSTLAIGEESKAKALTQARAQIERLVPAYA